MAIIKSLAIGKAKGSMQNITYRVVGDATIGTGKVAFPKIPRTYLQMQSRVKWANIVNLWQAFEGDLHPSFENRRERESDFNAFIRNNIKAVPVYLTKDEAQQGACVVAGYLITEGSLPAIDVAEGTGGVAVTDIGLGDLVIDAETTLKDFSDAVIENNLGYLSGDQISCFIAEQSVNSVTGVPYVNITSLEVTLNSADDETLLSDIVDALGFSAVGGKLGASSTVNGAITWVHSRRTADGVSVSTQRFFATNSTLAAYQTASKRIAAINSYGGKLTEPFLTPNNPNVVAPN